MKLLEVAASLGLLAAAYAQSETSPAVDVNGTVLGVFVYHNYCDRTSLIQPDVRTPGGKFGSEGATMCKQDGEFFYNKYFRPASDLKIWGSKMIYDDAYVNVNVPSNDLSLQSATAFLQGIFSPIDWKTMALGEQSDLEQDNSSFTNGPFYGYQYVPIVGYGVNDPDSIWFSGRLTDCPTREIALNRYFGSNDYKQMLQDTAGFYDSLYEPYFAGVFERGNMNFFWAYDLYDYVKQNRDALNETLGEMPQETLDMLRAYASHLQFNYYANTSTAMNENWDQPENRNNLREMGARALARNITSSFENLMETGGLQDKFNVVLGNHDLMISFFALAGLTSRSDDFYGLPDFGSSMIFEVYTDDPDIRTENRTLDRANIKVAFGFRNGTSPDDTITYWPLFDEDPQGDPVSILYDKFIAKMDALAVQDTQQFCDLCELTIGVCANFATSSDAVSGGNNQETDTTANNSGSSSGMEPAVAGVIGAVVTLAVLALAGAIAFFGFGVGVNRDRRRSSILSGIGSGIGGGLGGVGRKEKLSSEIELPLSPTAGPMPRRFEEDEEDREYGTVSSTATKVASPVASPEEAHFKTWESRF
ncbi:hypothetical protein ABW19_dt0209717 [Dactylella cylindrospora]|nr:hypothetical protein ABW19_dt0209717 [Dactylella cylindrospora]